VKERPDSKKSESRPDTPFMLFVLFNFIVLEGNAKIAKKVNFLFKEGKDKKERWVKRMVMKVGSFELGVLFQLIYKSNP
jgi:hypothetical protein